MKLTLIKEVDPVKRVVSDKRKLTGVSNVNIRMGLYKCDCGTEKELPMSAVKLNTIKSCGCLRKIHGKTDSPTFYSWRSMIARCTLPEHRAYKYYGGKGIAVCDSWLEKKGVGLKNLINDIGERPSKDHSIDRIDSNGNYEPSNCRWADRIVQQSNKSNNNKLEHNGRIETVTEWARITGIKMTTLKERLVRGWSIERTLTTK